MKIAALILGYYAFLIALIGAILFCIAHDHSATAIMFVVIFLFVDPVKLFGEKI